MQYFNIFLESRQHSVPAIRHNNTFVNSFNETIYNPDQAHSVKVGWSVIESCLILCSIRYALYLYFKESFAPIAPMGTKWPWVWLFRIPLS